MARRRRRRAYDAGGGGGGGLGWLLLYGLGGYLLYNNWGTWFGGTALPAGGAGAPTYWVRAEDGQVVASHTGPPTTSTGDFGWGNWTPADAATVAAAAATASIITIS